MLHKSLYSEEDTRTECCSTIYCKCLNVKIDFINQAQLNRADDIDQYGSTGYQSLETALDSQSGINSTLFFRAFLLSINVKFKWLIGCTMIYNDDDNDNQTPFYLYKCHCCSYDLFVSTSHILGKCLINYELQNFDKYTIVKREDYSPSFNIVLQDPENRNFSNLNTDLSVSHPLTKLVEELREREEAAMKQRIEDFKRKEEENFATFCDDLEKEYNILTEYASQQQYEFDKYIETVLNVREMTENDIKLFDFEMKALIEIEREFNQMMEENLKLDNEEVYNYLNEIDKTNLNQLPSNDSITKMKVNGSGSSLHSQQTDNDNTDSWLQLNNAHELKIKLPINEMGEITFISKSNRFNLPHIRNSPNKRPEVAQPDTPMADEEKLEAMNDGNLTDPPSQSRSVHESPSGTIVEHDMIRALNMTELDIAGNDDLYDNMIDEDENIGFDAISEEEDNEELMFALDDEDGDDLNHKSSNRINGDIDNSYTQTPGSSAYVDSTTSMTLKMIPELNINNNAPSQDTLQTMETESRSFNMDEVGVIQEDSETDDRIFGFDSPIHDNKQSAFTRTRGVASHSKNDSLRPVINTNYMLSPLASNTFKVKTSKSLQINKSFKSKSLLSKTLNKNSALVNLNNRDEFNTDITASKYHPNNTEIASTNKEHVANDSNYQSTVNPKTFNPPKQWLDVLKEEDNKKQSQQNKKSSKSKAIPNKSSSSSSSQNKLIQNNNGTLTVNNHTFTGIWAKTLPKQPKFPDFNDEDVIDDDDEKKYDSEQDDDDDDRDNKKSTSVNGKDTVTIHSLFENKQSQQVNNVYAYSVGPKYSAKEMDSINNSNND